MNNNTKAVILAAWYGTRMLPITKTIPKEMLPVGTKPTIQYTIDGLVDAGINDIVVVTAHGKNAIEDYFDKHHELEQILGDKWKHAELQQINHPKHLGNMCFVKQKNMSGVADALKVAQPWVRDADNFVLVFADQIYHPHTFVQALDRYKDTLSNIVVTHQVPREELYKYGVVAFDNEGKITDLVEKPKVEDAPSDQIISGVFVFKQSIFDYIDKTQTHPILWEKFITDSIKIWLDIEDYMVQQISPDRYIDVWTPEKRYAANTRYFNNNGKMFGDID